ncbi:MAG: hypothetical protein ACTIAF_07380, partial [Streptococcus thermophilus]
LPNDGLVAFHYSSYGTFCIYSKRSIISTVVLPTTEIIEPLLFILFQSLSIFQAEQHTLCELNDFFQTKY